MRRCARLVALPGVAAISPGRFAVARVIGLRGEAVEGIELSRAEDGGLAVAVHIVARLVPLPPLADAVRAAVAAALAGAPGAPPRIASIDVWVDALRAESGEEIG